MRRSCGRGGLGVDLGVAAAWDLFSRNLSGAKTVDFGAAPGTIDKIVSGNELKVTTPKGSGTVDVTVSTVGGTSAKTAADRYTY